MIAALDHRPDFSEEDYLVPLCVVLTGTAPQGKTVAKYLHKESDASWNTFFQWLIPTEKMHAPLIPHNYIFKKIVAFWYMIHLP